MYLDFYNLKSMPFQLSPDPSFFYASPGHKRVMSYLQYGLLQGDGFIVVTGGIGTGKTTLIQTLLKELQSSKSVVVAQLLSTQLESDDLLRMVTSAFDLQYENLNKPALLKGLEQFFRQQAKRGKRVLLIVDEVQNLPVKSLEELRMLSNYQEGNKALFQSFLIGQAEFRNLLKNDSLEQLRQRIIASYHLGPLNFDDTVGYIEHRLSTAGWKRDPAFVKAAYVKIFEHTDGVPRRINTLCDRALLVASLKESHTIDESIIDEVVAELNEEAGMSTRETGKSEAEESYEEVKHISERKMLELERRINAIEVYISKLRDALSIDNSNIEKFTPQNRKK